MKRLVCWLFGHRWISTKEHFMKDKSVKNQNNFIEAVFAYCTAKKICSRCGKILEKGGEQMSKALIEKAFEKYCLVGCSYRQTNGADKCENTNICKHAWGKGATWQREQLEAEIKALKEQVTDLTNGNYKKGIHTMEQLHKIVEDRNKTIDWWTNKGFEDLDKIKELQAENKNIREQIIKELREWATFNREQEDWQKEYSISYRDLLAKLDLLEGCL